MPFNTVPVKPLRRYALEGIRAVAYWRMACGVSPRRACATVLVYHSIAPLETARFINPASRVSPAVFARQMRFLARHCRVVSLSTLIENLSSGRRPEAGTVVITFDDGYLDTLRVAAPILAQHHLPATLYLPTAHITDAEPQWSDRLHTMFASRTRDRLSLGETIADVSSPRDGLGAHRTLGGQLRAAGYQEQRDILEDVRRQLQPSEVTPRLTMCWNEVRQLVRRYPLFEIGGHSVHHADLSACDRRAVDAEVHGCISDLAREVGQEPRHFAFPYGRSTAEARHIVGAAGFASACAAARLLTDERSDRFAIGRLDPRLPMTQFKFWSSGAYASLTGRLARP